VINQFVEDYPTISARQVTLKFTEVCARSRPECVSPETTTPKKKKMGRTFMFYLRPCFYQHLAPEDRPENWEKYAIEDEKLWQLEQEEAKTTTKSSIDPSSPVEEKSNSRESRAESVTSDVAPASGAQSATSSVADDDGGVDVDVDVDIGDETEEDE
jgi:hypothetical protein